MIWTEEPPRQEGTYLARHNVIGTTALLEVFESNGKFFAKEMVMQSEQYPVESFDCMWHGPMNPSESKQ